VTVGAARATVAVERRAHETSRVVEHGAELVVARLGQSLPGRQACLPQRLRTPDIPDPRNEALVEERVAQLAARVGGAETGHHLVEVGRIVEDVRPEVARRAVRQLEDGSAAEDREMAPAAQDEPGQAGGLRSGRDDPPAPVHAEVTAQDDPALETEQQVFPAGLDALEHTTVEALCDSGRLRPRMAGLDPESLADEHLQASGRAVQGVAFGHLGNNRPVGRFRSAVAGAVAAGVWAAQEPLDQRVFRYDYSDVALLGKFVMRGPRWRQVGLAVHMANGAVFGLAYHEARSRLRVDPQRLAIAMATGEHLTLFSLGALVDRFHPARGEPGLPPIFTKRAFAQATWRHLVFGWTLGKLAG
jgi:hypothetical protein